MAESNIHCRWALVEDAQDLVELNDEFKGKKNEIAIKTYERLNYVQKEEQLLQKKL